MSQIRKLLNFIRDEAISVDGRFVEIDVAPFEDELEQLQQAHREGWEQCKIEAIDIAKGNVAYGGNRVSHVADAIAAMEYKEKANER